jgi:hypothetical protein
LLSIAVMFAMIAACASYPPGVYPIWCTNDCDQQFAEQCPDGFEVLRREELYSSMSFATLVRVHYKFEIKCHPPRTPCAPWSWWPWPSKDDAAQCVESPEAGTSN